MKLIKIVTAVLLAVLICLTSVACGDDYKDAFIYVELNSRPQTLDPQLAETAEEITVVRSVFDTLLRFNLEGEIVPSAAESYETDGLVYTFKLKTDAKWTNGTPVTADDFVFGFQRALSPETDAPYANNLFSIKNARDVNEGRASISTLGVWAEDEYTLKIELEKADTEFAEILTMPVTAPCNREIFENAKGKYGLTVDATASNGSYYVRIWNTEDKFLIRLAKNLDFKGDFEANSMRIYFTCSEKDALYLLENDNTDLSYVTTEEYAEVTSEGFEVLATEDICYALFISPNLDKSLRTALLTDIDNKSFASLVDGTRRSAETLFPSVLKITDLPPVNSYIKYDVSAAQEIYSQAVLNGLTSGSLTIKYPSDPSLEAIAKSVAAHWQQGLSCFVNMETASEGVLNQLYKTGSYDIIILPISSVAGITSSYISQFGIDADSPHTMQGHIFGEYLGYPICFSTTNIGAGKKVQNLEQSTHNGIVDVAQLIKMQ